MTAPDWSAFGALFPVLAGSSGAGASVLAAALTDALAGAGQCTLLVDPAEPSRSGLSCAASRALTMPCDGVRWSWRGQALVAQLDDARPEDVPRSAPSPSAWLPTYSPIHSTVVDLGSEWARLPQDGGPLSGPAGWLQTEPGTEAPRPFPLLVVRATRPSLMAAEAALARFQPLLRGGEMAGPAQLVVMSTGKPRWRAGVAGAAGARLAPLLDDALFVPFELELELAGITESVTPPKIRQVLADFLRHWAPSPLHVPSPRR